MLAGKRDGFGVQKWQDGAIYDGNWKNDVKNGYGTLTMPTEMSTQVIGRMTWLTATGHTFPSIKITNMRANGK